MGHDGIITMVPSVRREARGKEGRSAPYRPALAVAAKASTRTMTSERWSFMIPRERPCCGVPPVRVVTNFTRVSNETKPECAVEPKLKPNDGPTSFGAAKPPAQDLSRPGRYMAAILKHVLLLQRNVPAAAAFYEQGLGLIVTQCSDSYAELGDGLDENGRPVDPKDEKAKPRTVLALKAVGNVSQLTTGYSPFVNFEVRDMDTAVNNMLRMGAELDGPIKYPPQGKVAALRGPDGHMLGLYEMSDSPFAGGNVMMDMDSVNALKEGKD